MISHVGKQNGALRCEEYRKTSMVAMNSRLEINFNRLLNRCEILAAQKKTKDWRLEKVCVDSAESKKLAQNITKMSAEAAKIIKGLFQNIAIIKISSFLWTWHDPALLCFSKI